jgi:hypothetical protein
LYTEAWSLDILDSNDFTVGVIETLKYTLFFLKKSFVTFF